MRSMLRCGLIMLTLVAIVLVDQCIYASYINKDNQSRSSLRDLQDHGMRQRSACIEGGGSCDHDIMNCCQPTVCRCNFWGTNCRCARAGLF